MTEHNHLTFAAIIRISLPDQPDKVTANVTLTAADAIPDSSGEYKPLTACTLADLQAFADQLEADVWETYESIKLVELADHEDVGVELTILDQDGERMTPSKEWFEQAFVVRDMTLADTEADAEPIEQADKTVSSDDVEEVEDEEAEAESPDVTDEPKPVEEPVVEETAVPDVEEIPIAADPAPVQPQIKVSEPIQVYEEPEADPDATNIAPSQARVRIAGQRKWSGHPTWAAVDILMDEPALRAAQAHALTSLDREVAGVMVGPRPEKQPDGRYVVHVIDTIVAKYTVMQGASVTYTPESWRYMNDTLRERYPDETAVIVGWYHTHPGFGIFLSGMDQFIHQNFFTQIWHIAYVLDPRARTSGFFCWDRQKTRVSPYEFAWPTWAARTW